MSTSTVNVFMPISLEGFLYGLYSGIFAIYLQHQSKRLGTALILFYAVCLLYVLSTAAFFSDLVALILHTRIDTAPMIFRIYIVQSTVGSCCDFLAQCILIYRCWIVWGKNIYVAIIPSFLAVAYLATWLGGLGASTFTQGGFVIAGWGLPTSITGIAASMAVNALVTGLIVFKILKVFLEVNPILVELTLDSTGGTKLQHVVFVMIESGMALLAIQLIRLVFYILPMEWTLVAGDFAIVINEMLNGITPTIILVRVSMKLSFDDPESFKEAVESLRFNNPPSDPNTSSMPPQPELGPQHQEKDEDT